MGAGLLYLFIRKDFRPVCAETGLETYLPQGFGTAKRGREAVTAPKADNTNHVAAQ